MLSDHWCSCYR